MVGSTSPGHEAYDVSARQRHTAWSLVTAQFALIAVIVALPNRGDWPVSHGLRLVGTVGTWTGIVLMAVAGLGLGRGLTAAPLPNAHAQLRTGGLYRFVRHPIYFGLLVFTLAQVISSGSAPVAVAGLLLVALINAKARWEESRLRERFPGYSEYASRTPRFIPRLRAGQRHGV